MRMIWAMAAKDLRLLMRDKAGFFFTFFFPILFAIFFGVIFAGAGGGANPLAVALVDEDGSTGSRGFVETLRKSPELKPTDASRADAASLVRRGKLVAYVVLPNGFGATRERIFYGTPPKIEVGLDPARTAEAGLLEGVLTRHLFQGMQDAFTNPNRMRENSRKALNDLRSAPVDPTELDRIERFLGELDRFMERPIGGPSGGWKPFEIAVTSVTREGAVPKNSFDITFPQGVIWGILACAAAFGIGMVVERTKGTLVRLRLSPVTRAQILAGKGLACFLTTFVLATVLIAFAVVAFKVRPSSWPLLAMALTSISLTFVGIMMLLSVCGKTESAASGIGWSILTVMAMLGGGMVPLFIMPTWMQTVGAVSPVRWSILAMEGAIWRGFTFGEMLLPCGVLLGMGSLCFVVGVRAFKWTEQG